MNIIENLQYEFGSISEQSDSLEGIMLTASIVVVIGCLWILLLIEMT